MSKGLPKYCKHLYKHNPRSTAWNHSTGNTSIINCNSCKKCKRLRSEFVDLIWKDHTNPRFLDYILESYHRIESWEDPNSTPRLVIKFNKDKLNQDYPVRCLQHSKINPNTKRRFGSGFTRRQWKKERELNGGKH